MDANGSFELRYAGISGLARRIDLIAERFVYRVVGGRRGTVVENRRDAQLRAQTLCGPALSLQSPLHGTLIPH